VLKVQEASQGTAGLFLCLKFQEADIRIRYFNSDDLPSWRPLWAGYLAFYDVALPDATTQRTWARLLDPSEPMIGFGAFIGDTLVGICHVIVHRSTWAQRGYAYLEDLFVAPDARGKGAGGALIKQVYEYADSEGLERVYWATEADNPARALYDQVADESGFVQYRRRQ